MINIYFEDESIIVCQKPYGVSSQASNGDNMPQLLASQTGSKIYPVHRLDITTTGIMVYAKTEKSAGLLSSQIANGELDKTYLAICHNKTEKEGEMLDYLYHDKLKNKSFVVKSKRKGAKEARLEFNTLGSAFFGNEEFSLLKIHLLTGRTHQIRAQLASRGHVLYGDGKYGAKDNDKIALHSYSISFKHPITKEKMEFKSLPKIEGAWQRFCCELEQL